MIVDRIVSREAVDKGWSGDRKYRVTDRDGNVYLLRLSPPERRERKGREFANMERAAALGIPMCRPLEFGECEEGVYFLLDWIDGVDARDVMGQYPGEAQYAYGRQAGEILKRLHTLPAPADGGSWAERYGQKIDRKIAMYETCPLKYAGGEAFVECIAQNRHLIAGRPQTYQHGDYHIGNMMIDKAGKLVIIDFDRDDWGDPWEEFNRIVWCAQYAPRFAAGIVDGYFDGLVPGEFWHLLALYISVNTLSSLPWAIPFGPGEIEGMHHQAELILGWYRGMTQVIPAWYA